MPGTERPNYRRAEAEAKRILHEFGIVEPPVNPIEIARELGIDVKFAHFEGEGQSISGFYDCESDEIIINRAEFPLRQTFTVAHELGHKILHEEWAKSSEYRVLMRNPADRSSDPRETEANHFAANLLMPRDFVDRYYGASVPQLSRLFAVSVPAVETRLASLYGIG